MVIDAHGPNGNAFAIMARVKQVLRDMGRADEWEDIRREMMAGDYDAVCTVAEEVSGGIIQIVNRPSARSGRGK